MLIKAPALLKLLHEAVFGLFLKGWCIQSTAIENIPIEALKEGGHVPASPQCAPSRAHIPALGKLP